MNNTEYRRLVARVAASQRDAVFTSFAGLREKDRGLFSVVSVSSVRNRILQTIFAINPGDFQRSLFIRVYLLFPPVIFVPGAPGFVAYGLVSAIPESSLR